LDVSDLTVTIAGTNDTVTTTNVTYDSNTNAASFSLPALADADYHAVLSAAGVYDANNNHPASDTPVDFFYLAADANHDRSVDLTDFTILAANFNGTAKTWAEGDFNYDTKVDLTDFTILASNFNKSLPAAAPPAPQPSA